MYCLPALAIPACDKVPDADEPITLPTPMLQPVPKDQLLAPLLKSPFVTSSEPSWEKSPLETKLLLRICTSSIKPWEFTLVALEFLVKSKSPVPSSGLTLSTLPSSYAVGVSSIEAFSNKLLIKYSFQVLAL